MVHRQNSENAPSSKSSSKSPLEFFFLTLFPEVFQPVLGSSLLGKAQEKGLVAYRTFQIRDFSTGKHQTVDDTPYGGGEGMVMKPDVLHAAWSKARAEAPARTLTILTSPQGTKLTQDMAKELATFERLIVICGHYEGVDERFVEACVDREISIGDYVLTGGELPAMVMADAITRLLPGVVGNERSLSQDSLEGGLLKYPQYTKPRLFEGREVPQVLLSGDHKAIQTWRKAQSLERTKRKRPDLRGSDQSKIVKREEDF
jgi:tRNA (guanine37-N1)-methyltransferase